MPENSTLLSTNTVKALLETGQYSEALLALTRSEKWFGGNPRLYLLAREVYRMNQEPEKAAKSSVGSIAGYSYGLVCVPPQTWWPGRLSYLRAGAPAGNEASLRACTRIR